MSDNPQELKPCPFCGKHHKVITVRRTIGYKPSGAEIYGEPEDAVKLDCLDDNRVIWEIEAKLWNTRPIEDAQAARLAQQQAVVEAAKGYLDIYNVKDWMNIEWAERMADAELDLQTALAALSQVQP